MSEFIEVLSEDSLERLKEYNALLLQICENVDLLKTKLSSLTETIR